MLTNCYGTDLVKDPGRRRFRIRIGGDRPTDDDVCRACLERIGWSNDARLVADFGSCRSHSRCHDREAFPQISS